MHSAILECFKAGNIPDEIILGQDYNADLHLKHDLTLFGIYSIVTKEWVRKFVELEQLYGKTVLEVMAGNGYLAKALEEFGVKVIATDDYSWYNMFTKASRVIDIEKISAKDAVKKYADKVDVLLVSWPYTNAQWTDAYIEWIAQTEKPVYYIGEHKGGCTAADDFFDITELIPIEVNYPQVMRLHDELWKVEKAR